MKRLVLLLMIFVIMVTPVAYAGAREEILDSMGDYLEVNLGKNNKGYYQDDSFNFAQIKKMIIITSIQKGGARKLTEPEIIMKSEVEVKNKINENFNTYMAENFDEIASEYRRLAPIIGNDSSVEGESHWKNYFYTKADTIVHIEVLAYNQARDFANVAMVFTVYNNGKEVLCYKDFRLNAKNSVKEGVFDRIVLAFVEKMDKAVSDSKSKRK